MSDITAKAVAELQKKLPQGFDGIVKFDMTDAGTIILDPDGVREADAQADCTLTADAETFEAILTGEINPTSAFMSGQLQIDGDMGMAMRLAGELA